MPWLAHLCTVFAALEAVLACAGSKASARKAEALFGKLEESSDTLMKYATLSLLRPTLTEMTTSEMRAAGLQAGDLQQAAPSARLPPLCAEGLRLPMLVLARCCEQGPEALTVRELLGLARGDLFTAVAVAVACLRAPGLPPSGRLQVRLWELLLDLSTPQCWAELAGQEKLGSVQELQEGHVVHMHCLAMCLLQADALEACCDAVAAAAEAPHRAAMLRAFFRLLHTLSASQESWASGRLLARRICVLWSRFGGRVLAPHLRRLLAAMEGSSTSREQAARDFRRDLRTLAWLLHHAPELQGQARPLCAELTLRCAQRARDHAPETLAVVLGAAANSAALESSGEATGKTDALFAALEAVETPYKEAVCQCFPAETKHHLWIVQAAWPVIEELGFWPKASCDTAPTEDGVPNESASGFKSVMPESGMPVASASWNEDDWGGWDGNWEDADQLKADTLEGPLGQLNVQTPASYPLARPRHLMKLLCKAPSEFCCALDGRICTEPVQPAPSGRLLDIVYQRSSILSWLSHSHVCPVSGQALRAQDLIPAVDRRASLVRWLGSQRW